jgi:hypothetical protein
VLIDFKAGSLDAQPVGEGSGPALAKAVSIASSMSRGVWIMTIIASGLSIGDARERITVPWRRSLCFFDLFLCVDSLFVLDIVTDDKIGAEVIEVKAANLAVDADDYDCDATPRTVLRNCALSADQSAPLVIPQNCAQWEFV